MKLSQYIPLINEHYNGYIFFILFVSRTENIAIIIHAVYIFMKHDVETTVT